MKKDLKSYRAHDRDFNSEHNSFERTRGIIQEYDRKDYYKNLGFKLAIEMTKYLPSIHIDIGSGNGWLMRKTSPYFEKVIGVEPSQQGIEVAKKTVEGCSNVEFVNLDMVDAMDRLDFSSPVFMTTATVLNHIENSYVAHFLSKVNNLPIGSALFFDERYDTNIDWSMWHVRSRDWWRKHLPSWQLLFFDIEADGYRSGIYGIKVAKEELIETRSMSPAERLAWSLDSIRNILLRVIRKMLRICRLR